MEREMEIVITSLDIAKYAGLHPKYGKLRYLVGATITIIRFYYFYCCLQMLRKSNGNIDEIIEAVGTITSFTQALAKMIPLMFYTNDMLNIIEQTKLLRKQTMDLPSVEKLYKYGIKTMRIYKKLIMCILMCFYILPIFSKQLIFAMWVPEFAPAFWLLLLSQYILLMLDVICVLTIDTFYVSVCINIIAQFYLLNAAFVKLDDCKDDGTLKAKVESCIRHHAFLLQHMKTLKKCYSVSLMLVYLITVYSYCTQLYGFIERNTPVAAFGATIYLIAITCQLAIYCFPADAATQIALETSYCISGSRWYSHSLQVQKYMPLTIMQSQRPLKFTAGGLVDIDKTAFVKIFKTGFSFYTIIKSVQDKI